MDESQRRTTKLEEDNQQLRDKVNHLVFELDQMKEERQALFKKIEDKDDFVQKQEFEDSDLVRGFEQAISTLNLEMHKCKKEHKNELQKLKEKHEAAESKLKEEITKLKNKDAQYLDQIAEAHRAMQMIAEHAESQLEEKNQIIQSLEEYQDTYRKHI